MAGTRVAEAVAVSGGRIAYVGSDGGVGPFIGPATEVIELGGRMVLPVNGTMLLVEKDEGEPTVTRHGSYRFVPLIS